MTGRHVRIGVVLPQTEIRPSDPAVVREFARQAEEAGFDHLLAYDHVLGADSTSRPGWDGYYDHTDPFLEPLTLFAHLGAVTTTLEFGTEILIAPQRQTALLAKQTATLAVLLEGRLRLGVGIGWNEVEYDALGVPFRTRGRRLEEQIGLLRRLWTEPVVDHRGEFDVVDRAGIEPRPARSIPVWIGCGDAPAALERVGRMADGWIPHPALGHGQRLAAAWRTVREAAERAGRDPDTLGLQGVVPLGSVRVADIGGALERWVGHGATHVAVNPLLAGHTWPTGHLDACLRVAEVWREAAGSS